jgi:hypothetical protein
LYNQIKSNGSVIASIFFQSAGYGEAPAIALQTLSVSPTSWTLCLDLHLRILQFGYICPSFQPNLRAGPDVIPPFLKSLNLTLLIHDPSRRPLTNIENHEQSSFLVERVDCGEECELPDQLEVAKEIGGWCRAVGF